MARTLISAAHKSSGKTTITIGLCAAFAAKGLQVQPFKKGPDYIDPLWLGEAAQRACHNLDFYTMEHDEIKGVYSHYSAGTDIQIIEGNKGLYDGLDIEGSNSNAALAKLLQVPVILVLDAQGMTRGIAPLILGYQAFDSQLNIAGVILNKLGGSRHERKLRQVIEHYTDVTVLGAVHRQKTLEIKERHLGLIPSNESSEAHKRIQSIRASIESQVDLDKVFNIATLAQPLAYPPIRYPQQQQASPVHLGVAVDSAFGFYYAADLEAFERAGATIVKIDTLNDRQLPAIDGLFIGGGFPETQMAELEKNRLLREQIKNAIESGLPTYAECGGLMYLCRSLQWQHRKCAMVGVIPADVVMHERPVGRGYIQLRERKNQLWPTTAHATKPATFCAHEFHYSSLENVPQDLNFAYDVLRGRGVDGTHDGIIYKNLLANYAHFRDVNGNHWTQRFIDFIRSKKPSRH